MLENYYMQFMYHHHHHPSFIHPWKCSPNKNILYTFTMHLYPGAYIKNFKPIYDLLCGYICQLNFRNFMWCMSVSSCSVLLNVLSSMFADAVFFYCQKSIHLGTGMVHGTTNQINERLHDTALPFVSYFDARLSARPTHTNTQLQFMHTRTHST